MYMIIIKIDDETTVNRMLSSTGINNVHDEVDEIVGGMIKNGIGVSSARVVKVSMGFEVNLKNYS